MKRPGPLLSLLLLLASPAMGGTVLPALHPCPVDAPWQAQQSEHAGHEGHHQTPSPGGDSHDCTCISSCSTGPALAGIDLAGPIAEPVEVAEPTRPSSDATLVLAPIAERLPPAIPPPSL
jgi:hypothetical protein